MDSKKDISGLKDIQLMVDDFYNKIKKDDLLSSIFFEHIPTEWQPHLNKMYLFWNAALFGEKGYAGNPFSKHAKLTTITPLHFERWLLLFNDTINTHFSGNVADDAKKRAAIMANNFMQRLAYNKQNNTITIV